ncbi:hypothetical protein SESBI_43781 [Sesbania bispinosa]|nr:hypothetical protein SESBI_43781 [Sesbania bispinosa]
MEASIDVLMDPKPPDDGVSPKKDKATFRDTLLGNQNARIQRERVDLISNNLFRIEHEEANRLKPHCYVVDSVLDNLRRSWRDAIIIKLLGKRYRPRLRKL